MDKTCATCIENDNGLCDRKGILIQEDDTCDNHREDWRQQMHCRRKPGFSKEGMKHGKQKNKLQRQCCGHPSLRI